MIKTNAGDIIGSSGYSIAEGDDRIIRRAELEAMTSLTERQIRTLERENKFPQRFLIAEGGRAVGWSFVEVQAWLQARKEAREAVRKPGMPTPGQRIGEAVE